MLCLTGIIANINFVDTLHLPVLIRHAPALSLSWTFLYLLFFRLVTWFDLPQPTPFANAIQLILTLKMVSLANEVHSFHIEKKRDVSSFAKSPVIGGLTQEPSLFEILSYSYCYVGIMTGKSTEMSSLNKLAYVCLYI
ncbi:Lysophospholipid acyltransferase 7 [Ataeniobius toweri]|uniref:Lysophospholipid acyltransferase 7 n=1 Tax=Ataeniobius toweri TaxID=208326 RepID=A0ABU7B2V8_9TELE|nr:Lysophospholipid acyltransferase 7 [Ataeniobius toweri]